MNDLPSIRTGLLASCRTVFGWPLAAITAFAGLVTPAFVTVKAVPYYVALPVGGTLALFVIVLAEWGRTERQLARDAINKLDEALSSSMLPAVTGAKTLIRSGTNISILVAEYSPLYARGHLVSIFQLETDNFERPLGYGQVDNIQSNGLMQVEIIEWIPTEQSAYSKMNDNDASFLSTLVVKPSVPSTYLLNRQPTQSAIPDQSAEEASNG